MVTRVLAAFLLFVIQVNTAGALTLDDELRLVTQVYKLKPAACNVDGKLIDERLTPIGKIVFNTPVLSGDNDTSCSTCHIDKKDLSDGLPVSIGVGGKGTGMTRMHSGGVVVARNSFTLFGRASPQYKIFFWDGKIQAFDGKIYSPIGEGYSLGFKSPLAVAAIMPILARDEFLGRQSFMTSNENLNKINAAYYGDKLKAANKVIGRIVAESKRADAKRLAQALRDAGINKPSLPLIGNALASFIASKVRKCTHTPWDRYLSGEKNALSERQKQGAIIFYGKGRCAGCHSGNLFSDFKFHSIGTPQGEFGTYMHHQDIGRADVTYRVEDRYQFRTPPLIHVSMTAPYGHNGTFKTMEEVVRFHINPIPFFALRGWTSERELLSYGKLLATRSDMLGYIDISDKAELDSLLDFLHAL